jgi:hypothetical protein
MDPSNDLPRPVVTIAGQEVSLNPVSRSSEEPGTQTGPVSVVMELAALSPSEAPQDDARMGLVVALAAVLTAALLVALIIRRLASRD